jgi:5-methylcytosine-specific restriction protein A
VKRTKRLARTSGLPRTGGLSRVTPMTRTAWKRKPVRDTGPTRKVRALVLARDGFACVGCNKSVVGRPYSLQHRVARGMGGTSRADAGSPVNLIVLCGSATSPGGCHLLAEQRDPVMHERGLWLNSWEDPATVPVMIATALLPVPVWPTADGRYSKVPPEGTVAA